MRRLRFLAREYWFELLIGFLAIFLGFRDIHTVGWDVASEPEHKRITEALSAEGSGFVPIGLVSTNGPIFSGDFPVIGSIDDLVEGIYDYGADCLGAVGFAALR